MKTCLYNGCMNPFAYQVFPQLYSIQPDDNDFTELARFNGTLRVVDVSGNQDEKTFTNTNKIDLSTFTGSKVRISLSNEQGNVLLGVWTLP